MTIQLKRLENGWPPDQREGEREEVSQIFQQKGFEGEDLQRIVGLVTVNRQRWVRTMLTEEHGLPQEIHSPWIAAISTFTAFLVCGLVPLIPYLLKVSQAFELSIIMTGTVFFSIGSAKSKWSTVSWWRSGLTTLLVGAIAAGLAYGAGMLLKSLLV